MQPVLFICHANCCRSVIAQYLYAHLNPESIAESAGVEVGDEINDRADAILRHWGIDARAHRPRRLNSQLCANSGAMFFMAPEYLHRMIREYGLQFASKSYLFADPFSKPSSFSNGGYLVRDPSFDCCPISELVLEFQWFHERVSQIHQALSGSGKFLVPAISYLNLLES
jgi:protein-tyrosine-phosphatase